MRRTKRIDAVIHVDMLGRKHNKIFISFEISKLSKNGFRMYDRDIFITMLADKSEMLDNRLLDIFSLCRDFGVYEIYLDSDHKISETINETIDKFKKYNAIYMQFSPRFMALNKKRRNK